LPTSGEFRPTPFYNLLNPQLIVLDMLLKLLEQVGGVTLQLVEKLFTHHSLHTLAFSRVCSFVSLLLLLSPLVELLLELLYFVLVHPKCIAVGVFALLAHLSEVILVFYSAIL